LVLQWTVSSKKGQPRDRNMPVAAEAAAILRSLCFMADIPLVLWDNLWSSLSEYSIYHSGPPYNCFKILVTLLDERGNFLYSRYIGRKISVNCRLPGFTVMPLGKCLAGGRQSGCTVNLAGAQYGFQAVS
jgi:hypothetical protein